jgi:hypothetical protein
MRIVISGPAAAYEDIKPRHEITDPTLLGRLHGLSIAGASCADWLDVPTFDEIDLTGGAIQTAFDQSKGRLRVVTEYRSPRRLSDDELKALLDHTYGQWSDGLGEGGLHGTLDGKDITVDVSPGMMTDARVVQADEDPAPRARFTKLFSAVRRGDLASLRAAIAAGDELNVRKSSMPALHWALAFGHAQAALLLIRHGAEVTLLDGTGQTALQCCAAARDLSDEDAAAVATELLRRGLDGDAFATHRKQTFELAEDRGKTRLAAVLQRVGDT